MTGTLPNLALAQRVDQNGLPASGARLFIFEANTSTPAIAYKDYSLTVGLEHPQPIVADALGLIPMFWLPDGFYRARLEDQYGTPLIDEPVLPALGTGGGGEAPAPPAAIQWVTGDFIWQPVQGTREGWVRANGRTIGDGSGLSGAEERANNDTANLFAWHWLNFPNGICPVLPGGRGADAPTDFAAHKTIATIDMRGAGPVGLDGMGNSLAGRFANVPNMTPLTGGTDIPGSRFGANEQTMTESQMPNHVHTPVNGTAVSTNNDFARVITGQVTPGSGTSVLGFSAAEYVNSIINSMTMTAKGGSQPQNNMALAVLGSWFVRL